MGFYNAKRYRQAQPGAIDPCRDEGFEKVILNGLADAVPIIPQGDLDMIIEIVRRPRQMAIRFDSVAGVGPDIFQHLTDQIGISRNFKGIYAVEFDVV